uniref:Uncharacterized protein n=1 Tax=Sphaerodactylus townsendi TaxID=933632 RepID=A0ACB8F6D3_9SAUR
MKVGDRNLTGCTNKGSAARHVGSSVNRTAVLSPLYKPRASPPIFVMQGQGVFNPSSSQYFPKPDTTLGIAAHLTGAHLQLRIPKLNNVKMARSEQTSIPRMKSVLTYCVPGCCLIIT